MWVARFEVVQRHEAQRKYMNMANEILPKRYQTNDYFENQATNTRIKMSKICRLNNDNRKCHYNGQRIVY